MESEHLHLLAAGAGLVIVLVVLVVASVSLIVARHEARELAQSARQHAALLQEVSDLRRLTLNAISGRAALETDLKNLIVTVKALHERVLKLEGAA